MKIRLTENRLRELIYECVQSVLSEGKPGIQSQKLYNIMQQHGGLKRTNCLDVHNLRDEDIVTVMPLAELGNITSDKRYIRDHGRWADSYGLDVWAKENGVNLIPGDRMSYMELGDGEHAVIVVNRNENQVQGREGEGWDAYHQKRQQRERDKKMDGSNHYIPRYERPWNHSRIWKNPFRKEHWTQDEVDNEMDAIRDYHLKGDSRKRNY